jgi:hypothetical protein
VLSLYWVDEPAWQGRDLLTVLRLMCIPRVLVQRVDNIDESCLAPATLVERALLQNGFDHPELVDFSMKGLGLRLRTRLVNEHGWTDLYLCGIDTDSCVLKTAVDTFERNPTPWILKDACASHAGAHAVGLFIAARFIGANQIIQTTSLPESVLPLPA